MTPVADALFLGVDIGGSSVETVVTDRTHRVAAHALEPTDTSSPDAVVQSALTSIRGALVEAAGAAEVVAGIGIGAPGQVDAERGIVRFAMNLNIGGAGLALGAAIEEVFGLGVVVENDVRAAAVGAYQLFRSQVPDLRSLVYLSIGTGLSAGVVVDGGLRRGREGLAGEIGHVVVDEDGPPCRCGLRGCLEAVAAGPAVARSWPRDDGRNAEDLFRAAAEGRADATRAAAELTTRWVEAIQWLALAHGADLVVLGGGVGSVGGPLLASIRERLARFAERSELARRLVPPERVVAVPTGHPTGAIGAAAVARERLAAAPPAPRAGGEEDRSFIASGEGTA